MENKENTTETNSTIPTYTKKIGSTNYIVNVNFSKTATETIEDKIKRMVLNDCKTLLNKGILVND